MSEESQQGVPQARRASEDASAAPPQTAARAHSRRLLTSTALLVATAGIVVVAADEARRHGYISELIGDLAQYGIILLLGLALVRLVVRAVGDRTVRGIFLAALICLFVSGLLNVTNDVQSLAGWPLLAAGDPLNTFVKDACELAAVSLVLFALVVAILSSSRARDEMLREHQRVQAEAGERIRAEAEARAEKEFTDTVLNAQLDTFVLLELAPGRAVRWNKALTDISGYSDEEIAQMPAPASFFSPEDRERVETFMRKVLEEGDGTIELDLVCKDGRKVPTEYRVSAITDERGEPRYLISIGRDITERKRAEDAVNAHISFLHTVMDESPFAMWISDREGVLLRTNRALRSVLNVEDEQLVGKYCVLQDGNLEAQGLMPQVRAVFEESKVARFTIPWTGAQAGQFEFEQDPRLWIDVSMFPILDKDGNLTNVVCQWVDVTEHKRAEEALRESEERLNAFFGNSPAGMAIFDAQLRYVYVNEVLLRMNGAPREEHIGRTLREVLPNAAPRIEPLLTEVLSTCKPLNNLELSGEMPSRPGETTHYLVSYFPISVTDGTPRFIGTVVIDISDRKQAEQERAQLEQQYRQAQKMEAIGQLTGGVAHDFNNLLQVINVGTEMALQDLDSDHPAAASLIEVAKAGERAARLVSQLLLFSRRQIMQPEFLDLNTTVTDLLKMLGRVIGEHIQLQWRPGASACTIHADRGMIEQVLMNLCVNARDAMPEGGMLTIQTSVSTIDEEYCATHSWAKPGRYALLNVTDTGCGIAPEDLDHVFEPFFTTKETGKGTGLGLATVYGIIKQHDGLLHTQSQPGKGTSFELYWPLHDAEAAPPKSAERSALPGGNETILLAEDEPRVRKVAKLLLERAGYKVLTASDGAEATALFEERCEHVDMAILDVVMPKMGGRDAYDRMRQIRPDLKALFASGYSDDAIHKGFVLDRGLSFVQKPFSQEGLLNAVRDVLDAPQAT